MRDLMMRARAALLFGLVGIGTVQAQPKTTQPGLVGATEVAKFGAPAGFVDDVVAADADRLAYVVADGGSRAELHVVTLATKADAVAEIGAVAPHPVGLELVGPRAFVVNANDDGSESAALVELADKGKGKPPGTVVWKTGPAKHIRVIVRDGKPRAAVHRATEANGITHHEVEVLALDNGARIAPPHALDLDGANTSKALELRVNHWSDGFTRAYGIKSGTWDPKENQRSPDVEATYDFVAGKIVETKKIDDLFEQRKRFQALADGGGKLDFVRFANDGASAQLWHAGKAKPLELDQPFTAYEPKSVQAVIGADGSAWVALKVDPVNPEAVARKKADAEYLDVFRVTPDGKGVRKVRVLATGVRHRFGVVGNDRFWLIERNAGFERGGKSLVLYQLQ